MRTTEEPLVALATFRDTNNPARQAVRGATYPRTDPLAMKFPEFFRGASEPVSRWPDWAKPRMVESIHEIVVISHIIRRGDRLRADDPTVKARPRDFLPVED